MALKSVPGLTSKVCDWAGPPAIQSRMHDLCLAPWLLTSAARLASTPNQPDTEVPSTPAAESRRTSRRDSEGLWEPNMANSWNSTAQAQPLLREARLTVSI